MVRGARLFPGGICQSCDGEAARREDGRLRAAVQAHVGSGVGGQEFCGETT